MWHIIVARGEKLLGMEIILHAYQVNWLIFVVSKVKPAAGAYFLCFDIFLSRYWQQ
jgi:hypothetical protein